MNNGKAKNVIEYLDNLVEKGKATQGAIVPLKTAFTKVMSAVDKDSWEDMDVKNIDVDDYILRFSNLTAGTYSTQSISVYKSRVNRALGWYSKFLETPGWAPDVAKRSSTQNVKKASSESSSKTHSDTQRPTSQVSNINPSTDQIIYQYPLLSGELIQISLPVKLSKKDAARISTFVSSIAIEETPMLRDVNP